MKPATQASVLKCIDLIRRREFDEIHVKSLLIDLRAHMPDESLLREVAHFIADPDQRDRGLNHRNVKRVVEELREHLRQGRPLEVRPTFTGDDLLADLRSSLAAIGFADDVEVIDLQQEELLVCLLTLMQGASLKYLAHGIETFLVRHGPEDTLALVGTFEARDLDLPDLDKPYVSFSFPLVTTSVSAPKALLRGKERGKIRLSLYRTARDSDGRLTLEDIDQAV